jgi:hypothetical protein
MCAPNCLLRFSIKMCFKYYFTLPSILKANSFKAALHDAITEASQVCKLFATSYLSFVNIYFLKINGKSSAVQVAKQDGWQGKWTELFYF